MKISYQCDICGKSSKDRALIEVCEGQGRQGAFLQNASVQFFLTKEYAEYAHPVRTLPESIQRNQWHEARVAGVRFEKGTHSVTYQISLRPKTPPHSGKAYIIYRVKPEHVRAATG